jgi:hypothetical protein
MLLHGADDRKCISLVRHVVRRRPTVDGGLAPRPTRERVRLRATQLEALLTAGVDGAQPLAPGFVALKRRSQALAPIVAALAERATRGDLTQSIEELRRRQWSSGGPRAAANARERARLWSPPCVRFSPT